MGKSIVRVILYSITILVLFIFGFWIGQSAQKNIFGGASKVHGNTPSPIEQEPFINPDVEKTSQPIPTVIEKTPIIIKTTTRTSSPTTSHPETTSTLVPTIISETPDICSSTSLLSPLLIALPEKGSSGIQYIYLVSINKISNNSSILKIPGNLIISGSELKSLNLSQLTVNQIYLYIIKNAQGNQSDIKNTAMKIITNTISEYFSLKMLGYVYFPLDEIQGFDNFNDWRQFAKQLKSSQMNLLTNLKQKEINLLICNIEKIQENKIKFSEIPADNYKVDNQGNFQLNLESFKIYLSSFLKPE
jgi:hypothetical protein